MTKKQIREYYNTRISLGDERIVDIDPWTVGNDNFVIIITITKNHVIWKNFFEIVDNELKTLETKILV